MLIPLESSISIPTRSLHWVGVWNPLNFLRNVCLSRCLDFIGPHLTNAHPRARYSAFQALGQTAYDHDPYVAEMLGLSWIDIICGCRLGELPQQTTSQDHRFYLDWHWLPCPPGRSTSATCTSRVLAISQQRFCWQDMIDMHPVNAKCVFSGTMPPLCCQWSCASDAMWVNCCWQLGPKQDVPGRQPRGFQEMHPSTLQRWWWI